MEKLLKEAQDFSQAKENPFTKWLKKQVTINKHKNVSSIYNSINTTEHNSNTQKGGLI
jgi:hypothetical protein